MKKLLFALLMCPSIGYSITNTHEVAQSSWTTQATSVSSSVATNLCPYVLAGRFAIEVQNQHATANLWLGQSTSTNVVSSTLGRKLGPGAAFQLQISNFDESSNAMTIYGVNDSGSGATTAQCTQLK